MKIAQVINNFSHTSIPVEMAELMAREEEVDIISLYDSQETAELMAENYSTHAVKVIGCNAKKSVFKGIKKMRRCIREGNYDIIQTHHSLSAAITSFFLYKKGRNNPAIITTIHGNSHSYSLRQNLICGYVINHVDGIVYNSNTTKNGMYMWQKKLIKRSTKQKVIYNGINTERIMNVNCEYANTFKKQFDIPEEAFLIVQIGRLEKVKNPIATLMAFDKLLHCADMKKNVYLVFIGDGSQKTYLEEYISANEKLKNRVRLTGTIKRENVYSIMHIIGIQIIPSLYEGFCNALFESLSVGNQVIVSDISVFSELVKELEGVEMFDPRCIDSISESLKNSIQNPISQLERSRYMTFAKKKFDTSICKDNYLLLYRELL